MLAGLLDLARRRPLGVALLLAVTGLLAVHVTTFVRRPIDAWGYDESTHVQLPAARLVLAEGAGDRLEVLNDCDRYPPVVPVYQATIQGLFGLGEAVARRAAFGGWLLAGLLGLALVGRGLGRRLEAPGEFVLVPLLLALLSPLVWRYAPTLFLEVPFLVVATWTLAAWLWRQDPSTRRVRLAELAAGLCVTVAFFTKFNYGLQLGAALGLDWLAQTIGEVRRKRWREHLARSRWLVAPPLVAGFFWFIYPPGGVLEGQEHWEAFRAYLGGNMELAETGASMRLLNWGTGAFAHPAWLLAACGGAAAALLRGTVDSSGQLRPPMRCLWLLLLLFLVPSALHPFHLDRFLVPGLLPLWLLAAVGSVSLFTRPLAGGAVFAGLCVLSLALPRHGWAELLGVLHADPGVRAVQEEILDEDLGLFGQVPTAGLSRQAHDQLADMIQGVVGPEDRVVWIGMSPEYSPAALHLALLERGGGRGRFLSDSHLRMDVLPTAGGPAPRLQEALRLERRESRAEAGYQQPFEELSKEQQASIDSAIDAAFAAGRVRQLVEEADLVLMSAPADLKGRSRPGFQPLWQAPVLELGWSPQELGQLQVLRPHQEDLKVSLFVLRKTQPESGR